FRKLLPVALVCFAFLPQMQAAPIPNPLGTPLPGYPNPDGCYANFTTAEGCNALNSLGAGLGNTGLGWYSLFSVVDTSFNTGAGLANFNTAVGAEALLNNTNGDSNNAVGAYALTGNTIGIFNQAMGFAALSNILVGSANVAIGDSALVNAGTGGPSNFNTVIG